MTSNKPVINYYI